MRRRLLVIVAAILGLFVLLFILAVPAAPLWVRLGVKPICIQGNWPHLKVVACPGSASAPSTLEAGVARPILADAQPFIIDTDMAADDWMAILYLLQRPDVDVRAITVTGAGEAHCQPGVQNALGLTALAGRPQIPVACGRETPLKGDHAFPMDWRKNVDALLGANRQHIVAF